MSDKQNWHDSDDLDLMFHGTYPREFYRLLHKMIHNEYRYNKILYSKEISKFYKLIYHMTLFKFYQKKLTPYLQQRKINFEVIN